MGKEKPPAVAAFRYVAIRAPDWRPDKGEPKKDRAGRAGMKAALPKAEETGLRAGVFPMPCFLGITIISITAYAWPLHMLKKNTGKAIGTGLCKPVPIAQIYLVEGNK
jgi:hypothetical protein